MTAETIAAEAMRAAAARLRALADELDEKADEMQGGNEPRNVVMGPLDSWKWRDARIDGTGLEEA